MKKLLFLILTFSVLFSQESIVFKEALRSYKNKDYLSAKSQFRLLLKTEEKFPAQIMLMFTEYASGNYENVLDIFSEIERKHENIYLAEAHYVSAKALFQLGKYDKALLKWIYTLDLAKDNELQKKSASQIVSFLNHRYENDKLLNTVENIQGERSLALLSIFIAEKEEANQNFSNARYVLSLFEEKFPNSKYIQKTRPILQRLNKRLEKEVNIAIFLPFESIYNDEVELANSLMSGIEFAVEEFNKKSHLSIQIRKVSTGNSIMETILAAEKIVKDRSISAVVGPHISDFVAAVSPIFSRANLPLITPTAMQTGLSELSANNYLLNSDYFTLGKFIAEYSFSKLGHRSYAVIHSSYGKSNEIAKGFLETIKLLGAELVSEQIYHSDFNEVTTQFNLVRNAGIKKMYRDSLEEFEVDSALEKFDSLYQVRGKLAAEHELRTGEGVDSSRIYVNSIDAIFLPITKTDSERIIPYIAQSYVQNKFETDLLGSEEWYDAETFEKDMRVRRSVNGIYVFTPNYLDMGEVQNKSFSINFSRKYGKLPILQEIQGYRSIMFLTKIFKEKNNTRKYISEKLQKTDQFPIVGGTVHFDYKDRVNSGIHVLQFDSERFKKVRN